MSSEFRFKRKMKVKITLFIVGILSILIDVGAQDVESWLQNPAYVNSEINCVLERGPCDMIGRSIKRLLPEALNNNCRNCSANQARISQRVINFMQTYYPNEYRQILQRYSGNRS